MNTPSLDATTVGVSLTLFFSRGATGVHRWAKLFKLNFFIRKTSCYSRLSNP